MRCTHRILSKHLNNFSTGLPWLTVPSHIVRKPNIVPTSLASEINLASVTFCWIESNKLRTKLVICWKAGVALKKAERVFKGLVKDCLRREFVSTNTLSSPLLTNLQDSLLQVVDDIGSHLEYFQELEHATRMLNHPGESLLFQPDFHYMVERVNICIEFLKGHVCSPFYHILLATYHLTVNHRGTTEKRKSTSSVSSSV